MLAELIPIVDFLTIDLEDDISACNSDAVSRASRNDFHHDHTRRLAQPHRVGKRSGNGIHPDPQERVPGASCLLVTSNAVPFLSRLRVTR